MKKIAIVVAMFFCFGVGYFAGRPTKAELFTQYERGAHVVALYHRENGVYPSSEFRSVAFEWGDPQTRADLDSIEQLVNNDIDAHRPPRIPGLRYGDLWVYPAHDTTRNAVVFFVVSVENDCVEYCRYGSIVENGRRFVRDTSNYTISQWASVARFVSDKKPMAMVFR